MKFIDLTLVRFLVFNLGAFLALGFAYINGWVDLVIESDSSRVTWAIAALFLYGWFICLLRILEITKALNQSAKKKGLWWDKYSVLASRDRASARDIIVIWLTNRIAVVRQTAEILVILGLIGTVLGFILAFQGISPDAVVDTSMASQIIAHAMSGMSVALYTTLCGAIGSVWLMVCYRILQRSANHLAATLFSQP